MIKTSNEETMLNQAQESERRKEAKLNIRAKDGEIDEIKKLLEEGTNPNGDGTGITPLMNAAKYGNKEAVDLLLKHGAVVEYSPIYYPHVYKTTPLMLAAYNNHEEIVDKLIASGANVNAFDGDQRSVLDYAQQGRSANAINKLINAGADVNSVDEFGKTNLAVEISSFRDAKNSFEIIKILLENGADANFQDNHGNSPLMKAVKSGQHEVAKLLIENGADVNLQNQDGKTAASLAYQKGDYEAVKMLTEPCDFYNIATDYGHDCAMNLLGQNEENSADDLSEL